MVDLRKNRHLKREKSKRGLIYYSFKTNYKCKNRDLEHIIKEISTPVVIKLKQP